ncbi:MAG: helix-turn-helix domain-containing protein [bacterium]|nr:helix-turn-helix domain-containing protein [bacterium]
MNKELNKLSFSSAAQPSVLDVNGLCSRWRVSKRTLYRMIDSGECPKPFKVGSTNRWLIRTIEEHEERLASSA